VDAIINQFEGPYIDGLSFSTGCCTADADCVTTELCATGICGEDGGCTWEPVPGCCHDVFDCAPSAPCMVPICTGPGATCEEMPAIDCCQTEADCDDDDPCTVDLCPVPGSLCNRVPLCCSEDIHCQPPTPCFDATCEGGECVYVDICCQTDADCDDGDGCTVGTCVDSICLTSLLPVEGCCLEDFFSESFDTGFGLAGWTFEAMTNGVGWSVVSDHGQTGQPSPPGALYYGSDATWSYNSGGVNDGKVRTPFITLPLEAEVFVAFAVWLDVQAGANLDTFEVFSNGPGGLHPIFDKSTLSMGQWQDVKVDVSALAGQTVQFGFAFDTETAFMNDGLGVLVDDLRVSTTCVPRPCESAADCPSADHCVVGSCSEGSCTYQEVCCQSNADCDDGNVCTTTFCNNDQHCEAEATVGCCTGAEECDDGDQCTLDVCTSYGGVCFHPEIDGCCHHSGECDDGEVCTVDQCLDNVCAHTYVCCGDDNDCDDGDDVCTVDDCVDGVCVYSPTGLQGCCSSTPVHWDFETPSNFDFTATSPPCGWSILPVGPSSSQTNTLYYGNPATMDFACLKNGGTATSPEVTLMSGFAYTLSFEANLDVESNTVFDTLELFALVGDQSLLLWDKLQMLTTDTWYTYEVDVSALAGKTFRLRFEFDTHDEIANDSTGVYVDDVQIVSTCLPKPCTDDPSCSDDLDGTQDFCGLAGCEYLIP
ncbi:MAG: hypothetical protein QF464_01115, partial [Myxococcota bacterium]|jgi:hypothetical protein|nr:hypothetical protein [Myxococcota bacterium]